MEIWPISRKTIFFCIFGTLAETAKIMFFDDFSIFGEIKKIDFLDFSENRENLIFGDFSKIRGDAKRPEVCCQKNVVFWRQKTRRAKQNIYIHLRSCLCLETNAHQILPPSLHFFRKGSCCNWHLTRYDATQQFWLGRKLYLFPESPPTFWHCAALLRYPKQAGSFGNYSIFFHANPSG